jgi:hypothetical protein
MFRAVLSVVLLVISGAAQAIALEFNTITNDAEKLVYLHMWGPIVHGDDQKFKAVVLPFVQRGYVLFQVSTFTQGGDVDAAMKIGDQVRTLEARTVAPTVFQNEPGFSQCWFVAMTSPGGVGYMPEKNFKRSLSNGSGASWCDCASACFLIWASGVTREGNFVGIHRFKFDEAFFGGLPPGQAKEMYDQAEKNFRAYLDRLNVPQTILDRLFATPSTSIHYLTRDELQLAESTPYLEEQTQAKCGTSKARTYTQGNSRIHEEDPAHINCYRAILKELMQAGAKEYLIKYGS